MHGSSLTYIILRSCMALIYFSLMASTCDDLFTRPNIFFSFLMCVSLSIRCDSFVNWLQASGGLVLTRTCRRPETDAVKWRRTAFKLRS